MKRGLSCVVLATALVFAMAPGALAHDGGHGHYDSSGAHVTHLNAVAWQTLLPTSLAPLPDPSAENVTHLGNVAGTTGGHIVAQDDRLYMGNYGTGFSIYDTADPAAPVKIGQWMPGPTDAADPGARADAVPDVWAVEVDGTRRHIVAFGGTSRHSSTTRTEFVDATDPANLKRLWTFTGSTDGESHNSDVLDARGLWIPSGSSGQNGGGGLRIYDLRPLLQEPPAAPENLFRGNPHTLWTNSPYRGDRPAGPSYTHTHDVEAYLDYEILLPQDQWTDQDGDGVADPTRGLRDILVMAEGGNYLDGNDRGSIYIIDITNPREPVALNHWRNNAATTGLSPIRYYHEVQFVDGLDNVLVVTDEDMHNGCNAGGMIVLQAQDDLTQPLEPKSQWFNGTAGVQAPGAVCSMHVMSSKDGYLYDGSYNMGLQVIDLRDPAAPKDAGHYTIPGANSWGALAHGDYVYTGDLGPRGLDVFKFTPPGDASGLLNPNPAASMAGTINETACSAGETPTVDGLRVPIPDAFADGSHKLKTVAIGGAADTELDIWFYTADCSWMEADRADTGAQEEQVIPAGAAFGYIAMPSGAPRTRVDAFLN